MKVLLTAAVLAAGCFVVLAGVTPPAATVEEGRLAAAGAGLHYRRVGTGPDRVVYLHGGPGSNFRGQADIFERLASPRRSILFYDQRGGGRSEIIADAKHLTATDHIRDLEAIRRHFGFERMSIVGMSWGAGLAALYADAHPDLVERLLLVSPMPPTAAQLEERVATLNRLRGAEETARRRKIQDRLPLAGDAETGALCRELSDLTFRLYLVDPTPEKLRHAAQRCDIPPAAIRNRAVVEAATLGSIGRWDFRPMLAGVRAPALIVEGGETKVPLEATRDWAVTMPNARILLIPGAGHEVFLDRTDEFLEAADEFLGGTLPARAEAATGRNRR